MTDEKKPSASANSGQPKKDTGFLLDRKEEFHLLLKAVEDTSKHARKIMFVLAAACIYVLLAAFGPSGSTNMVKLPIINFSVPRPVFFAISPIVILLAYVYLHVYIRELKKRLDAVYEIARDRKFISGDIGLLLFPWMAVFALSYEKQSEDFRREVSEDPIRMLRPAGMDFIQTGGHVRFLNGIVLWLFGPVTLLVLWGQFVGQQSVVSIVPCLAVVIAAWTARGFAFKPFSTFGKWAYALGSIGLLFLTFVSVPALSEPVGLGGFWRGVVGLWSVATGITVSSWGWAILGFIVLQLTPVLAWFVLRLFGERALKIRLRLRTWVFHLLVRAKFVQYVFVAGMILIPRNGRRFLGIPDRVVGDALQGQFLVELDFRGVELSKADMSSAILWSVNLKGANLEKTTFKGANLMEANLEGANLQEAELEDVFLLKADLRGANLRGANLADAYLVDANLNGAILDSANLRGANLEGANLNEASLQEAMYSRLTIFPEGFEIPDTMILRRFTVPQMNKGSTS